MKKIPGKRVRSDEAFDYDRFLFYQGWNEGRSLKSHHLRDGTASDMLGKALDARGGTFGKIYRNGPATPEMLRNYAAIMKDLVNHNQLPLVEDIVDYRHMDDSFLREGKVLVVTTRLPMNDFQMGDKVQVQPGFTTIEREVIRACRPYIPVCSRSRMRIADALANQLPEGAADRADIRFIAYAEPWYAQLCTIDPAMKRKSAGPGRRTAVYLLHLPKVAGLHGADLIVMWGQGGTQTLAFAELLRGKLSHLLGFYGLTMVELSEPSVPATPGPSAPAYELLDAMLDWDIEVLLEGALLEQDALPRATRKARPRKKSVNPARRAPRVQQA